MLQIIKRMPFYSTLFAVLFVILQIACDLAVPLFTADMIDGGILKGNIPYIFTQGGVMFLLAGVSLLAAFFNVLLSSRISYKLSVRLREEIYQKAIHLSAQDFSKIGESSLITRTTNDVTQVQNLIEMGLKFLIISPLLVFGSYAMAYYKSPHVSEVFLSVLPIIIGIGIMIILVATPIYGKLQRKLDQLSLVFREGLTGLKVIRAFHQGDFELERFRIINKDYSKSAIQTSFLEGSVVPIATLVMGLANLFIIWVAGHDILQGQTQIGTIAAFMTYSVQMIMGVLFFMMIFSSIPRGRISAKRINEILNMRESIHDPAYSSIPMQDSNQPLLDFQSVSFSHLGAQNDTLSDLNFTLYAGKTLAIIGGTGSGKSTIAQLVPRLYDVASGHIFVEGQDVKEWKQSQLHDRISIVPQKSVLFSGSIKDNLTLGNPSATEEDIWGVLSIAQADFVKELPEGLDSLVEQGGKNFSGGQKQRLSIARALLKPSCIYIFDDSFSALDYKTDAQLRKSMKGFLKDVGVLLIAQRVSSIVDADEIIVLDNGKIVGKGTHEELKNNNHVYQEIMESQMGKEEL